ncbi:MAG: ribosome hibernation-promoting factor, HPF/YfiA family [Bacillota bacterium]|jgi:putative sigma-54 modulation protein
MQVNIRAKNLEVTPALREYLQKRLSKFEKMINAQEATATFIMTKEKQKVEITMPLHGIFIRGEEETYDMYTSIDNVVEKLERQVRKYKTRLLKKGRGLGKEIASGVVDEEEFIDEVPVKIKKFPIKPMPVEEAIMQMNLLGHNFFVFTNCDNNAVNVVYRRNDGAFGLLEPEV